MVDKREAFLFFLRRGLSGKPYTGRVGFPLTRDAWQELFEMARVQAVTGLFVDGVACTSLRPDRDLWEQWVAHLFYIEQMNERIAKRGEEWVSRLAEAGIRAAVFKGSSVAAWYPNPLHRSFGDIDIVVEEDWGKVEELLRAEKVTYQNERGDLIVHEAGLTAVELHPRREYLYNPVTDARLQALLKGGISNELYLVCLIVHLRRHFLTYGIGLKQVCDVVMMLRNARLDREEVARMLHRLRMERFSRTLFGFIDMYLEGCAAYPLTPVFRDTDMDLLRKVVFGDGYLLKLALEERGRQSRFPLCRIMRHAWFWTKRGIRLGRMMPGEAGCFLLHQVVWRMKPAACIHKD